MSNRPMLTWDLRLRLVLFSQWMINLDSHSSKNKTFFPGRRVATRSRSCHLQVSYLLKSIFIVCRHYNVSPPLTTRPEKVWSSFFFANSLFTQAAYLPHDLRRNFAFLGLDTNVPDVRNLALFHFMASEMGLNRYRPIKSFLIFALLTLHQQIDCSSQCRSSSPIRSNRVKLLHLFHIILVGAVNSRVLRSNVEDASANARRRTLTRSLSSHIRYLLFFTLDN